MMIGKFGGRIKRTFENLTRSEPRLGEVVHDYGVVGEKQYGGGWYRTSLMTCRQKGQLYLAIKTSWFLYLSAGCRYEFIPATSASKLREALNDLEALERNK